MVGVSAALVAAVALGLSLGSIDTPLIRVPAMLWAGLTGHAMDDAGTAVLWSVRAPRVVLGLLTGATLAMAGAALQGIFRNPLADPGLVGVSAGAALAASGMIVGGGTLMPALTGTVAILLLMPASAFLGAIGATLIVLVLSRSFGRTDVTTMLLIGIAINALASAGTATLTAVATDVQLRSLSFWLLGSLGAATWELVAVSAVPMLIMLLLLPRYAQALDLLLLGEDEARHLGIRVERVKHQVVVLVALGVGAAVAATGLIGFVGLIVPHAVRLALGPSHRWLMPIAALLGALVLVLADTLARTLIAPIELPIGAVTAALGAPVFLHLIVRTRRSMALA